MMFYVRSTFIEQGQRVHLHEGPWDHSLAEVILADIGVDASIPRGIGRQQVLSAVIVPEADVPVEERYGAQG